MYRADTAAVARWSADLSKAVAAIKQAAADTTRAAGFAVEAHGKANAPVLTGYLRNSIGVDFDGTRAVVGPTASYGPEQEFGSRGRPGRHYMSRAADTVEPQYANALAALGVGLISRR